MNPAVISLELRDLRFTYSGTNAFSLTGVNIRMRPGQIVAVLGPNGSGKTTILKLANGRLTPKGGEILLEGKPLHDYSRREIGQRIGFVPQSEKISFDYTVLEYVSMGRAPWLHPLEQPTADDIAISKQAIADVGMAAFAHSLVTRLSGGQAQLVLLARALAQQTSVLLLDEASSQLDLANKKRFLDILSQLAANGKTILFTTHEPDVAAAIAQKAILMQNGAVAFAGPLNEVYTAQNLEQVYGTPIQLVEIDGRKVVLWT
jgi:iron complex transport system ATP-binding protein